MKKYIILLMLAFSVNAMMSQSKIHPWTIGGGFTASNMEGLLNQRFLKPRNYSGSAKIMFSRYINPSFNARLDIGVGNIWYPVVTYYPLVEPGVNKPQILADASLLIEYKFNNGYVFKENAIVQPYVMMGIGGNYLNEDFNSFFPWGGGIKFRTTPWLSINIETLYKLNIDNSYSYLQHHVGLQFNVGKAHKKKEVVNTVAPVPESKAVIVTPEKTPEVIKPVEKKKLTDEELGLKVNKDDSDGDGLADAEDECPYAAGSKEMKGCPDSDADGIADARDNCPFEKGIAANKGCPVIEEPEQIAVTPPVEKPAEKPVEVTKPAEVIDNTQVSDYTEIFYSASASDISAQNMKTLDRIAAYLNENSGRMIILKGYTSSVGTNDANINLSLNRALKVANYLASKGVAMRRIATQGYGPYNAKYPATDIRNQRVEIVIQ